MIYYTPLCSYTHYEILLTHEVPHSDLYAPIVCKVQDYKFNDIPFCLLLTSLLSCPLLTSLLTSGELMWGVASPPSFSSCSGDPCRALFRGGAEGGIRPPLSESRPPFELVNTAGGMRARLVMPPKFFNCQLLPPLDNFSKCTPDMATMAHKISSVLLTVS